MPSGAQTALGPGGRGGTEKQGGRGGRRGKPRERVGREKGGREGGGTSVMKQL